MKCASENIRIKSRHLKGGDGFLAAFICSTYVLCLVKIEIATTNLNKDRKRRLKTSRHDPQ